MLDDTDAAHVSILSPRFRVAGDTAPVPRDPEGDVCLITLPSGADTVRLCLQEALQRAPLQALPRLDREKAAAVLAEALNNIVEHAYRDADGPNAAAQASGGKIRIALWRDGAALHISLQDHGLPMPGGVLPAGHLPSPGQLPEGGFGWFLIRSLVKTCVYRRLGAVNHLHLSLA